MLTIHPTDSHGDSRWELNQGATLYDVTHIVCRSARYTPAIAAVPAHRPTRSRHRVPSRQEERCFRSKVARSKTMRYSS